MPKGYVRVQPTHDQLAVLATGEDFLFTKVSRNGVDLVRTPSRVRMEFFPEPKKSYWRISYDILEARRNNHTKRVLIRRYIHRG